MYVWAGNGNKGKYTFEERDKNANILLLSAFIANNPYLLSPIATSEKPQFHLENILADHVAAGKGC